MNNPNLYKGIGLTLLILGIISGFILGIKLDSLTMVIISWGSSFLSFCIFRGMGYIIENQHDIASNQRYFHEKIKELSQK